MKTRHFTAAILVLAILAIVISNHLQACRIIDPMPLEKQLRSIQPIETKSHSAEIFIDNQAAKVKVQAVFHNPNNFRMEGTYFFPLPAEVAVSGFSMLVNGKEMQGELLDADRARKVYEDIVRKMKDPGLLEFVGMQMIKVRVYPIEPRSDVEVRLEYSHLVEKDSGFYHFYYPLASAMPEANHPIGTVSIKVNLNSKGGLKNIYSPTHTIDTTRNDDHHAVVGYEGKEILPDSDFELFWSESEGIIGATLLTHEIPDEDGYFMLLLSPKTEIPNDEVIAKDVIFVLDKSGSMQENNKIAQAKKALSYCLSKLRPDDNFGIVLFSTATETFRNELVPATRKNIQAANNYLERVQAAGGTAIDEALEDTFKLLASAEKLPMVLFLTDGIPTVGETRIEAILKNAMQKNKTKGRIFAFGLGYDVNTKFLDQLSNEGHGVREYVKPDESIEVKISNLFTKIESPVLTDIEVSCPGVTIRDIYPKLLPDIFRGSQLVVMGRFEPKDFPEGKGISSPLRIKGKVGTEEKEFTYPVDWSQASSADFMPALWAVRKVGYLLEQIRLHGSDQELVDEVTRLGKKHGIVTPYTSFLVVEDGQKIAGVSPQALRRARKNAERILEVAEGEAQLSFDYSVGREAQSASESAAFYRRGGSANAPRSASSEPARTVFLGVVRNKMKSSDEFDELSNSLIADTQIRHLGGKTFYLKNGVWVDSEYVEADAQGIIELHFLSDEYFVLIKESSKLARFFSLGENVIVVHEDKVYKIVKGK